jgi:hypothetical protein
MEVRVHRRWFTEKSSISEVMANETTDAADRFMFQAFGLEDRIRAPGVKVPKLTAIPPGRYRLVMDRSQRFGRVMLHVLDVPGFVGIRIHAGNTDVDTEGCLILGSGRGPNIVYDSKRAVFGFERTIETALKRAPVWITYENINPPADLLRA